MEGEDTGKSVSVHIYATRVEELRGSEVNVEPAAAHRHSPQPARQTPHRLFDQRWSFPTSRSFGRSDRRSRISLNALISKLCPDAGLLLKP